MAGNEYALFDAAFGAYLQVGTDEEPNLPLDIAYAAGRQAARSGYSLKLNPYAVVEQRPHYDIWLAGFASAKGTP